MKLNYAKLNLLWHAKVAIVTTVSSIKKTGEFQNAHWNKRFTEEKQHWKFDIIINKIMVMTLFLSFPLNLNASLFTHKHQATRRAWVTRMPQTAAHKRYITANTTTNSQKSELKVTKKKKKKNFND